MTTMPLYGLAYADPNASEAQRSLMPPQAIHWFDGWRFRPHVYGVKGVRDPQTYRRVYRADPSQKIPLRFFADGFEYRFLGVVAWCRPRVISSASTGASTPPERSFCWARTCRGGTYGRG